MRMSYTNDPFISSIVALLRYFFGQFSLLAIHAAETYARQLSIIAFLMEKNLLEFYVKINKKYFVSFQFVSQTNFSNLWADAFNRYATFKLLGKCYKYLYVISTYDGSE